eukprot:SAG11_NODE_34317_length_272_cov_1.468208_1_plen_63_part_10
MSGSGEGRGEQAVLVLEDVSFSANMGGAIYCEGASVTLERISFLQNTCDGLAMGGGALQSINS